MDPVAALAATLAYIGCAAVGLRLAHHFVVPLSRTAALALVLLPLVLTGPALLTGQIYAPVDIQFLTEPFASAAPEHGIDELPPGIFADLHGQNIPWKAAIRHSLRHGQWPLWNPFALCGQVLAGSAQPAPYDPLGIPALLLPLPWSLTFSAALVLFVAALGAFLYTRDIGCREIAALVAAAGWSLCHFLVFFLEWTMGSTVAWLPMLFLAVRRVAHRPGVAAAAGLTAVLAALLLAGHPESAFHLVVVGGLYGLYEVSTRPGRRARTIAAAMAAGGVALLLCAVFLLPVLEAIPQSAQYHARHRDLAQGGRSVTWPEALQRMEYNVVPFRWGVPRHEVSATESVPKDLARWASAYVGSVLMAPALFGLWRSRWSGRWALLLLGLAGMLAGARAPVFADAVARLPLFSIAINHRLVYVGAFATVVLAALGIETWLARGHGRSLAVLQLAWFAVAAVAVSWLWSDMVQSGLSQGFLAERTALLLIPILLSAAIAGLISGRAAAALLLLLLVGQRAAESWAVYPTLPQKAFYPVIAPLDALPGEGDPYRIVGHFHLLIANSMTVYGIDDARGNELAIRLRQYVELEPLWSARDMWFNRVLDLTPPMLDFLNVRFAVSDARDPPPPGWRQVAAGPAAVLLENYEVLPRAFVPQQVRLGRSNARVIDEMKREQDFSKRAWISRPGDTAIADARNGPGTVDITRDGTVYLIEASMDGPGWVVISEAAWSGWEAVADDGRQWPVAHANHAFLGVLLPVGEHRLELRYRPHSFVVGRAISGATVLSLLLASLGAAARRRLAARRTGRRRVIVQHFDQDRGAGGRPQPGRT